MKKYINICNIYILFWCIYNLHLFGVLSTNNNYYFLISKVPLAINLLISLYFFFKVTQYQDTPRLLRILNLLIIMFSIYGVLLIASREVIVTTSGATIHNASYIISILRSLLPIYAFYYFCRVGYINDKSIKVYTLLLILAYIGYYQLSVSTNMAVFDREEGETTNNIGYAIVSLLPGLIIFRDRKILFYGAYIGIMLIVLMSMKRGAILIGGILSLFLAYSEFKHVGKIGKWVTAILIIIAIIGASNYISKLYLNNEYFQARVDATIAGDSSGRDSIASKAIDSFMQDSNLFQVLFGKGADSTIKVIGNYAHNDWLEILINQGLLGLIIFLIYWINYWKDVRSYRRNSQYGVIMLQLFIIYFLSTIFSMSYNQVTTIAALLMAYCLYYGHQKSNVIHK